MVHPGSLRKGLLNTVVMLILGSGFVAVAQYANSVTGLVSSVFLLNGLVVCLTAYFHMRLYEREQLEQLEYEELRRRAGSESIFEEGEDLFPARLRRQGFERYFVPACALLLLAIQVGGLLWLWGRVDLDRPSTTHQSTVGMALGGLLALLFYEFGKYSAVYARLEKDWLLRPQASYLLLAALLSLIMALVEVAGWSGYPNIDRLVAKVLLVFVGLIALENLLTLIFEIYRPKGRVREPRALYESRLVSMLSQPEGFFRTLAQAIDYQFGWKVSETWFYRFLERALGWLILLQLLVLDLSTCLVILEPGEAAVLEHWGRFDPHRGLLGPGLHLKWPWPIDKVYRFKRELVQEFTLGGRVSEKQSSERVLLWTKTHAEEEFNMLVASREQFGSAESDAVPVNLLSVSIPVHYRVRDLVKFVYGHEDGARLLQLLANRELTRYLVSVDLYDIMGPGRATAAEELRRRIQQAADRVDLGVEILFVGLHGIHPPVSVAASFEEVIGAIQDAAATNHYAKAYAAEKLPQAQAQAAELTNRAAAAQVRLISSALATAAQFTNQMAAAQWAPSTYLLYKYLDRLTESMTNVRKYVVAVTNADQVIQLDLQDKIRPDVLDITLPSSRGSGR